MAKLPAEPLPRFVDAKVLIDVHTIWAGELTAPQTRADGCTWVYNPARPPFSTHEKWMFALCFVSLITMYILMRPCTYPGRGRAWILSLVSKAGGAAQTRAGQGA